MKQWRYVAAVVLLMASCVASWAQEEDRDDLIEQVVQTIQAQVGDRSDEDFYDRTLPTEIPVAPFEGERYEATVPDTEDLADYANRSLNAATRLPHPKYFTTPQLVYAGINPAIMELRDGSLLNMNPKWTEPLPMLRVMTGSTFNIEVDGKMIGALVKATGKDGLCYQPLEGRPWGIYDDFNGRIGKPFIDVFGEGRQLLMYASWYQHDKNPLWKKLAERKIDRLLELSMSEGDTLYFPSGRGGITPWSKDWPRTAGGEMIAVLDVGYSIRKKMTGGAATYISAFMPQAGTLWYRLTGDEDALKLGGGLGRFLHQHGQMLEEPTGRYRVGHISHVKHSLVGNLSYALEAQDQDMIKWVKQGFEYLMENVDDPAQTGVMLCRDSGEIADMIQLGIALSRAGVGDYWEDVDRWVRNSFLPMQFVQEDVDRFKSQPRLIAGDPNNTGPLFSIVPDHLNRWGPGIPLNEPLPGGLYQPADGTESTLGAWIATLENRGGITGGGVGNCWRGLYYVWDAIVEPSGNALKVNLPLNRASPWADVDSYIPFEGKLAVKLKTDQDQLLIRIPEWTDWNRVACSVNAKPYAFKWSEGDRGYIAVANVKAGDAVIVEFPMKQWQISTNLYVSPGFSETQRIDCTLTLKGNTVIAIDKEVGYPLFLHEKYRAERAPMRKVERFVSDERFIW